MYVLFHLSLTKTKETKTIEIDGKKINLQLVPYFNISIAKYSSGTLQDKKGSEQFPAATTKMHMELLSFTISQKKEALTM